MRQARPLLFGAAILAAYAMAGLAGGWIWHELWQPSDGVVFQHQWYADGEALRQEFSATGLYVLVAAGLGLVLGVVFAVLGGARPVLTVLVCVAGALVAGWLMAEVGAWLGPGDPQAAARTAADGDHLPSSLMVSGLPPRFAFPVGSLLALGAIFTLFAGPASHFPVAAEPRE